MYAKDISTKIKSTLHTKARRGEYLGALDPYGYLRHPDDKHKLIINEETAPVVRRMFEMCAAGIGARSIATTLNNEGILSPKEYTRFRKHNPERDGEFERRHFWTRTYVQFMFKNEIYVGSMVQGRQYTPSYRSKKREPIPKEDWVVVPDMHEPIVSRELFDEAQKRMGARKKTIKAKDEPDLFAGLFFCEACGTSMLPKVSQQKYFYYNCGRSHAIVHEHRTAVDRAHEIKYLSDVMYPDAEKIILVMDNLNTHKPASLYRAFPPAEARRITRRLEIHYTPKHGSWLDMAEIELNVMTRQCPARRIEDINLLRSELSAWETERNNDEAKIQWHFQTGDAREKLISLYPTYITADH